MEEPTSRRLRILVCGDAFVGKTTLIDVLCGEYDDISKSETRRLLTSGGEKTTVGCYVNVRNHVTHERTRRRRQYIADSATAANTTATATLATAANTTATITTTTPSSSCAMEFVEVGGSRQYTMTRSVLYDRIHAVLLVHDVTNRKTMSSLASTWLRELTIADQQRIRHGGISARHRLGDDESPLGEGEGDEAAAAGGGGATGGGRQRRLTASDLSAAQVSLLQRIPVLIVGTKLDLLHGGASEMVKLTSSKYEQSVLATVFANGAPPGDGSSSGSSGGGGGGGGRKSCIVIDTYEAAEEAVSYRNEGCRMEQILQFLDGVESSSKGGSETA
jgi:GTPase SAR1 family protein